MQTARPPENHPRGDLTDPPVYRGPDGLYRWDLDPHATLVAESEADLLRAKLQVDAWRRETEAWRRKQGWTC